MALCDDKVGEPHQSDEGLLPSPRIYIKDEQMEVNYPSSVTQPQSTDEPAAFPEVLIKEEPTSPRYSSLRSDESDLDSESDPLCSGNQDPFLDIQETSAAVGIKEEVDRPVVLEHIDIKAENEEMNSIKTKKAFRNYSEESLKKAVAAIKAGSKIRETCRKYGVPRSTVQGYVKGRIVRAFGHMGPDPILTPNIEGRIVDWLISLAKCGFPVRKQELLNTVQKIVKAEKLKTPFKDGRPGDTWHASFLKRHKKIQSKYSKSLEKSRSSSMEECIRQWFKDLKTFLEDSHAVDILDDAGRILNTDESGFSLCPKTGKVLGVKVQNVCGFKKGTEKDHISVLITFLADGRLCPPVAVYPYVKPPRHIVDSIPPGWMLGKSASGWMTPDVFFKYISNGLNQWLSRENVKRPVLFLVDGHRFHVSIELSRFCEEHKIILYCLPPTAARVVQPADVSVFRPLKEYWRQAVREWQSQTGNESKVVTKSDLCPVFQKVLRHPSMARNIVDGFEACGLFPFNPDAVDYSKRVHKRLEDTEYAIISAENINYSENEESDIVTTEDKSTESMDCSENKEYDVEDIKNAENMDCSETKQSGIITAEDINTTEKVISRLRPKLTSMHIDTDLILSLVKSLREKQEESQFPHATESQLIPGEHASEATVIPIANENVEDKYEVNSDGTLTQINGSETQRHDLINFRPTVNTVDSPNQIENVFRVYSEITPEQTNQNAFFKPSRVKVLSNIVIKNQNWPCSEAGREKRLKCAKPLSNFVIRSENWSYSEQVFEEYSKSPHPSANFIVRNQNWSYSEQEHGRHVKRSKLLEKDAKNQRGDRFSSAISSCKNHYYNKEKKRQKKRLEANKTISRSKDDSRQCRVKQKCGVCSEKLDSDAEEENDKNVGCDKCTKWFHLSCTKFIGLRYADVADQEFTCHFCVD